MTKEVKRYDSYGYDGMSGIMKEHAEGDWVSAEDYAALEQECERLRAESENIRARWTEYGRELEAERDAALLRVEELRHVLRVARLQLYQVAISRDDEQGIEADIKSIDAALKAKP